MGAVRTLSEHACFGGVQGFYAHDSSAIGLPMRFGGALRTVAGIILYTAFMLRWPTPQTLPHKPITVAVLLAPLPETIFLQPSFIQKKARHKDWLCSAISSTGSLEWFSLPFSSTCI